MRAITIITFLLVGAAPGFAQAVDCAATPPSTPLQPTLIAPVANPLAVSHLQLGAPGGVLSQAYDETQSLDQVLLRMRIETCQNVASITPAPSVVSPENPAAYKPRTEFDNTPWRFNMSQNGKNMTADEFSAWMKSRGVRVARGAAPAAASTADVPDESAALAAPASDAPETTTTPASPTTPPADTEGDPETTQAPADTETQKPPQPR